MSSTLKNMSLSVRIIAASLGLMLALATVITWVFLRNYERDAQEAMIEKASSFTAVADEAKNLASQTIRSGAYKLDELIEEAVKAKADGKPINETRFFNIIPVVVGWTAAREAAEREGLDFRTPAFEARNSKNEPEPNSFEATMLRDLEKQLVSGGKDSLGRVNTATNTLHYMRAIKLDESCMSCHGDPAKYDTRTASGTYDGKDALGYTMEGWKVGDMHGAFEVRIPLNTMDSQVAGFLTQGLMWVVPLLIVSGLLLHMLVRVMFARPISRLITLMKDVATGEGDLTKRIGIQQKDEIGQLAGWFDRFMDNIHTIIRQVAESTRQVAAASTQIAASSEEMSAGLKQQQGQTEQVSAAIAQMSASVVEVAKKSAEVATAAESSGKEARAGGEVVAQTVTEMKAIAEQVNESAASVAMLGKKSEQIGQIIGVINDIADQTNLLALNAAIEAARAGEHGRGFAVVADEVRKLAERTTQATKEVATSIREIQGETTTAVERIEAGTSKVNTGVELAGNAGVALEKIVAGSTTLQSMVQSIAAAAEEQSAAGEQISRSVEAINAVTRESTEGAEQAAKAAAQLSTQAEVLGKLVGKFKI